MSDIPAPSRPALWQLLGKLEYPENDFLNLRQSLIQLKNISSKIS